ncbi:myelin-associated glycoprotein-like isoform X2 [Anguilla anguilla]|uniref:myelin-associated glycoprotein-like isoform X2 n=1 Tax=Anguilla anguilla TaxID=7936 RepID=UPI0015AE963F|nr:myelin-associated glycoprotein-like isoform X2 [Anguilla anguilla]
MVRDQDTVSKQKWSTLLLMYGGWVTGILGVAQPSSIEIQQSSFLVFGHKVTLNCRVSRFYPWNASVLWFHRGTPVSPGSITENITMNDDGTFSLLSQYKFSPTVKDNNAECVCQASHPAWTETKRTSIAVSVRYGPIVNVTSNLEAVTNGSGRVTCGSTLNLMCAADGNPKPMTHWLGESIEGAHYEETLHIPAVQREHEGLYWCVAKNMYGEQNTSITLLVSCSDRNINTDGNKTVCGLALIPFAWVTGIVICLLKKGRRKNNALAGQETVVYAEVKNQEEVLPAAESRVRQ